MPNGQGFRNYSTPVDPAATDLELRSRCWQLEDTDLDTVPLAADTAAEAPAEGNDEEQESESQVDSTELVVEHIAEVAGRTAVDTERTAVAVGRTAEAVAVDIVGGTDCTPAPEQVDNFEATERP